MTDKLNEMTIHELFVWAKEADRPHRLNLIEEEIESRLAPLAKGLLTTYPVVNHNGTLHAVNAASDTDPSDGSLFGLITFCGMTVEDNQEDPAWIEMPNHARYVTCERCQRAIQTPAKALTLVQENWLLRLSKGRTTISTMSSIQQRITKALTDMGYVKSNGFSVEVTDTGRALLGK